MSDLLVRDRVTAILTLAEAAKKALDFAKPSDVMFVAQFQHTAASETPWLARMLLEALDTIDKQRDALNTIRDFVKDMDEFVRSEHVLDLIDRICERRGVAVSP